MAPKVDHDSRARASLSKLGADLSELELAIAAAADGGAPLLWPLFEVFIRLAAAAEVCEQIVASHASGSARVTDDTLTEVAATLRIVREATTALVRFALVTTPKPN